MLPLLLPQCWGHPWVPCSARVPQGISTLPGKQQTAAGAVDCPLKTVPSGLCVVPRCFHSSLASLSGVCTHLSHSASPAEPCGCLRRCIWAKDRSPNLALLRERALGRHMPSERGEGDLQPPSGSSEGDVLGWVQKTVGTRGRSRFITCCSVTVGDWSCTSFSGESGQSRASSPPGRRLLLFPPLLPGTSLESLPVAGTCHPPTGRAFGNWCRRVRFLHRTFLELVSSPHSVPGSSVLTMPCRAITLAQPSPPTHERHLRLSRAWSSGASNCLTQQLWVLSQGNRHGCAWGQSPESHTTDTALAWQGWANNSHAGIAPVFLGSGEQYQAYLSGRELPGSASKRLAGARKPPGTRRAL